ncbi:hypothetical protein [Nostoc sp. C110]|uniref:hypothetical protein n=1 Tax=Nostoc sp. C110 TaxID=3349876 RepID=UPI00370D785A
MTVNLEIQDGNPWWDSPNIWTVPGDNPEGAMGIPIAGKSCYVWANVVNNGTSSVENATVRFYWANPSVGFDRTTANFIGTAYVKLGSGESADVLCLTPWVPQFVNEGHECLLAEAFHPALDPLPATKEFNVPTDRHTAQRNISVALAARGFFRLAFEIHNPEPKAKKFQIRVRQDRLEQIKPLIQHLGRDFKISGEGEVAEIGFVQTLYPCEDQLKNAVPVIDGIEIEPGQRTGLTLLGTVKGGASLLHVEQLVDNSTVGGLSVLVLPTEDAEQ